MTGCSMSFFAEGASFVRVFYGFFVADAGEADALDYYSYAFVVEVCHDDFVFVSISVEFEKERGGQRGKEGRAKYL